MADGQLNRFARASAFALIFSSMAGQALAIDSNIVGSWSASPKCDDDMIVHIKRNEYSGWEFHCRVLKSKRENGGWSVSLGCDGEGESYSRSIHWRLLKNGRLRHSVAGQKPVEMRRCSR